MARDTLLGFPRTPFLTVAENLLLYRQSQSRRDFISAALFRSGA